MQCFIMYFLHELYEDFSYIKRINLRGIIHYNLYMNIPHQDKNHYHYSRKVPQVPSQPTPASVSSDIFTIDCYYISKIFFFIGKAITQRGETQEDLPSYGSLPKRPQ